MKIYDSIDWVEDTMTSNSHTELHNDIRIHTTNETNIISILPHIIQNMSLYLGPHENTLYQSSSVPSYWNYSRFEISKIFEHDISYSERDEVRPGMSQTSVIFNHKDDDTIDVIFKKDCDESDCIDLGD